MFDAKLMGARLKSLRIANGCKQDEIAHNLHLSQSGVSGQELGTSTPPASALYWYAMRYNVSVDYILGLIDEPRPIKKDPSAEAERPLPVAGATGSIRVEDSKDKEFLEQFVRAVVNQVLSEQRKEET